MMKTKTILFCGVSHKVPEWTNYIAIEEGADNRFWLVALEDKPVYNHDIQMWNIPSFGDESAPRYSTKRERVKELSSFHIAGPVAYPPEF